MGKKSSPGDLGLAEPGEIEGERVAFAEKFTIPRYA
jgi:hypothetical protein